MDFADAYPVLRAGLSSRKDSSIEAFLNGRSSVIPDLSPSHALDLPLEEVLRLFRQKFGGDMMRLAGKKNFRLPSPAYRHPDDSWLKAEKVIPIKLDKVSSLGRILPLCLTRPYRGKAILLEGLWDMAREGLLDWQIRPGLFCEDLVRLYPKLNSPERQLSTILNLLHALGRKTGLRLPGALSPSGFCVMGNPHLFHWTRKVPFEKGLPKSPERSRVEPLVLDWLWQEGHGLGKKGLPENSSAFFSSRTSEKRRMKALFGSKADFRAREHRRSSLLRRLNLYGLSARLPARAHGPDISRHAQLQSYILQKLERFFTAFPLEFFHMPETSPERETGLPIEYDGIMPNLLPRLRETSPFFGEYLL